MNATYAQGISKLLDERFAKGYSIKNSVDMWMLMIYWHARKLNVPAWRAYIKIKKERNWK